MDIKIEQDNIEQLIISYFNAYVKADFDELSQITNMLYPVNEQDRWMVITYSDYIESYHNIKCHFYSGMNANSYVVFVEYSTKFKEIDTLVPGLNTFYVSLDSNQKYSLYTSNLENYDLDPEVNSLIDELLNQAEVKNLFTEVENEYAIALKDRKVVETQNLIVNTILEKLK